MDADAERVEQGKFRVAKEREVTRKAGTHRGLAHSTAVRLPPLSDICVTPVYS
jgi:hypothetical protein